MGKLRIHSIDSGFWALAESAVTSYLLEGEKSALLIDSGWNTPQIRQAAEELTDKPLLLALTHSDVDHIGGAGLFPQIRMHPGDYSLYHDRNKGKGNLIPLWEGQVLDLGNRPVRVIHMPGHTPGSVAFLDETWDRLICGDGIQDGQIYMFGPQRSLLAHKHSLQRLVTEFGGRIRELYPAHGSFPLGPDILPELIRGIGEVLEDRIPGSQAWEDDAVVHLYDIGVAGILYEAKEYRKYL